MTSSQLLTWVTVVSLYIASIEFVLWHLPVIRQMALEDWLTRLGLLSLILAVATSSLWALYGRDSAWRAPWFAVSGVAIMLGFSLLLWKYRHVRHTAALQPNVGVLPPS